MLLRVLILSLSRRVVRLSIGLEELEDLKEDLKKGLRKVVQVRLFTRFLLFHHR
jgi:hypothetical protein